MEDLADNVAVITGASAGIGRATARELLGAGARVVVGARRHERLAALEAEFPGRVAAVTMDVRSPDDCRRLVNTALELAMHDDEVKRIVERGMGEFEAFFRRCIEVAQARGQVPGSVDPATTAKGLVAMIVAIRLLGRGVYDASTLKAIAAQAQRLLH